MANVDALLSDARPGVQALTKQTIPEVGQLVRDLRETSENLRQITGRVEREGATSILGSPKLPEYDPKKKQ
jgi:phospholipid/cholesterol/gamma-HCH transport system substrate-binding protein